MDVATIMSGILAKSRPTLHEDEYRGEDGLIHCRRCGDSRSFRRKNPFGADMIELPKMCRCQQAAEEARRKADEEREARIALDKLRSASLMSAKLAQSRFETWRETPGNAAIRRLCEGYCRKWDEAYRGNRSLLFYGPPGTGKTFAAACIANRLMERNVPVMMTSFVRLMGEDNELLDQLDRARLLVIDDLGAERGTETALEAVYNIVDTRYRQGKPMILTTNLTLDEMAHADIRRERIYDRLREGCYPVEFRGTSWRKRHTDDDWWSNLTKEDEAE